MGMFDWLPWDEKGAASAAETLGFGQSGAMSPTLAMGLALLQAKDRVDAGEEVGIGSALGSSLGAGQRFQAARGQFNTNQKIADLLQQGLFGGVRPPMTTSISGGSGSGSGMGSVTGQMPSGAVANTAPASFAGATPSWLQSVGQQGYPSLGDMFSGQGLSPFAPVPPRLPPSRLGTTEPTPGATPIAPNATQAPAPEDQPQLNTQRRLVEVGPVDWSALGNAIPGVNAVRGLGDLAGRGLGALGLMPGSAAPPGVDPRVAAGPKQPLSGPAAPPGIAEAMRQRFQIEPSAPETDMAALSTPEWGAGRDTGGGAPSGAGRARSGGDAFSLARAEATRMGVPSSFVNNTAAAESGYNATAQNPRSSARGFFQITTPTWNELQRRHPDVDLSNRDDPAAQGRAQGLLYLDNRDALRQGLGREPSQGDMHLAHYFGASGAMQLLNADQSEPIERVVGRDVVAANPNLSGRTVGQVIASVQRRASGGGKVTLSGRGTSEDTGDAGSADEAGATTGYATGSATGGVANGGVGGLFGDLKNNPALAQALSMRVRSDPAFADSILRTAAAQVIGPRTAPTTRTRIEGDQTITEQWTGNQYVEVGRGPRWSNRERGQQTGERERLAERIMREIPGLTFAEAIDRIAGRGTQRELNDVARYLYNSVRGTLENGDDWRIMTPAERTAARRQAVTGLEVSDDLRSKVAQMFGISLDSDTTSGARSSGETGTAPSSGGQAPSGTGRPSGGGQPSTALPGAGPTIPGVGPNAPAPGRSGMRQQDVEAAREAARQAIARGANRDAVRQRLQAAGIDTSGL